MLVIIFVFSVILQYKCQAFPYKLETSGADVYQEVELTQDVFLYGKPHKKLVIYSNGIVALGKYVKFNRLRESTFLENPLLAPYYSQIYLKKTVDINITTEAIKLNEFNSIINSYYSNEDFFQAKEILDVTWKKFIAFTSKPMQTVRMLLGNDGSTTFMHITYKADDSEFYNSFQYYIYGSTMAGFSAGDNIRFKLIEEANSHEGFKDYLCTKSNMHTPGKWLYKLGSKTMNSFIIASPDMKLDSNDLDDINECKEVNECNEDANCINVDFGYACECKQSYVGNGRICLSKDRDMFVRGKINGSINGESMYNVEQTVFIEKDTSKYTIRALPLEANIGNVFLLLPNIFNTVGYLFARTDSENYRNGFDITGDYFTSSCVIDFLNEEGKKLYIRQKFKGFSNIDSFRLETSIVGQTPEFGRIITHELTNTRETFNLKEPGVILGASFAKLKVNGKDYQLKVSRAIQYPPYLRREEIPKHHMDIKVEKGVYSLIEGMELKIEPFITVERAKVSLINVTPASLQDNRKTSTPSLQNNRETSTASLQNTPETSTASLQNTPETSTVTDSSTTLFTSTQITSTEEPIITESDPTTTVSKTTELVPESTFSTSSTFVPSTTDNPTLSSTVSTSQNEFSTKTTNPEVKSTSEPSAPRDKDEFLVFIQSGAVKRFSYPYKLDTTQYIYTAYGDKLIGLDYDCKDELIYFTDATTGEINRMKYNGDQKENVHEGLVFPEGVSVDWLHKEIFWADSGDRTINIGFLNNKTRRVLFHENVRNPRSVVVHAIKGLIYWTDWDRTAPKIEVGSSDGFSRKIFYDSNFVATPNVLSLNYEADEICWSDANRHSISCASLSNESIRVVTENLFHPFGVALNGDEVYWTDWERNDKIQELDQKKGKKNEITSGYGNEGRLYDIKYVKKCPLFLEFK